ncbi:PD-(D/E)XK motif protein [Pseudarthrobacter oxydans]|uniref:PD-(D/E)XK motif protein n=1 Tax=Pseudarthrobacter oxydans TaxID=1671 RepID=UPI003437EAD8
MFDLGRESLERVLELLELDASATNAMVACRVPGREDDLFALDRNGTLLLLLHQDYSDVGKGRFRKYEAMRLMPSALYDVEIDSVKVRRCYRALGLLSSHRNLISAFAYLTASMLSVLPPRSGPDAVEQFIGTIVELLRSPTGMPEALIKGLWGELWLAARSGHAREWALAWQSRPGALYDFSFEDGYVEVKTHEGTHSQHRFSHEQLVERTPEAVVASVLLYRDEAGPSLAELIDSIANEMTVEEKGDFLVKCLRVLGADADSADEYRFSVRNTGSNAVISAKYIPKVVITAEEISDVRYTVDLSHALASQGFSFAELYETFSPGEEVQS